MTDGWNAGAATAVGIGIGAALAASVGPVGFLFGLMASFGIAFVARAVRRRT